MKRNYFLIIISLLICLFIYMFYRTEKTVINEIFIYLFSKNIYFELKKNIASILPLNDLIIYSLPEGLWIFCVTLTSKFYFIKVLNFKFKLVYFPLIISICLEFSQYFHLTNGKFDFFDIIFSFIFWSLANYLTLNNSLKNILNPINIRSSFCFFSYIIIYLSHVSN